MQEEAREDFAEELMLIVRAEGQISTEQADGEGREGGEVTVRAKIL